MQESCLKISHYIKNTKVLGPYNRAALWVQGCLRHCEGCLARQMNEEQPEIRPVSELADIFAAAGDTEGITISGGEPFLQAGGLAEMVEKIKRQRDYGVIVYTGYDYEQLMQENNEDIHRFLKQIDILIDGKYIRELDDGLPYRGSKNQRILNLSPRYTQIMEAYYYGTDKRNIEINVTENRAYLVGVPSKQGFEVWEEFRKKAGGKGAV